MTSISDLRVKIFADGADLDDMLALSRRPFVRGFTTNPTLMHKAGVRDYEQFARSVLAAIPDRPISFEVLSDEFAEMETQARKIATWGSRVWVKIPITNTRAESSLDLVHRLSREGVRVNVTAVMAPGQIRAALDALQGGAPANLSVFAGRIADTGRDPVPLVKDALDLAAACPNVELIWASPREVLNIFQADAVGCHIVTVTRDILFKLESVGRDLDDFSLDTVKMFRRDAVKAGLTL